MLLFSVLCALISAALLAVVAAWHRRAPRESELAHEKALYAAFVADTDRRVARGDIDAELANEERVEAARALLKAEAAAVAAPSPLKPWMAAVGCFVIAAAMFGVYLFVGHPWLGDQPYQARLRGWMQAAAFPACQPAATYDARVNDWLKNAASRPELPQVEGLAAALKASSQGCETVPNYWLLRARTEKVAGSFYASNQDFAQAYRVAPQSFAAWSEWGEAVALFARSDGTADARKLFERALTANPDDVLAHYYLGRSDLAAGNYEAARTHFKTALAGMAVNDSRVPEVRAELAAVDQADAAQVQTNARIRGMVGTLAAQLKADPENAEGWARLLRSYDVLHDDAARAKAVVDMQVHYRDRPEVAADILAKAQAAVGGENTGGQ
jgi:cytochrome c-type biogenesis protein CcmH